MTNAQPGSAMTQQTSGSELLSSSPAPMLRQAFGVSLQTPHQTLAPTQTHRVPQAPPISTDTQEANINADHILGYRTYSTQSSKIGYVDESPENSSVDTLAEQREALDERLEAAKNPWKILPAGGQYKVGKLIGKGSFGVVYDGITSEGMKLAIKFEPRKTNLPLLRDEYRTYKLLSGDFGFPEVYFFHQVGLHNCLGIQLLGPSLEELFEICERSFTLKTVVILAMQMLSRIQHLHEKNLIYRDMKPDNFLIGRENNTIYLIDLGLAKQYRSPTTKEHIPYRQDKSPTGTARYMSINTHLGGEQSRRDDLEGLWYVLVYFLRGRLPWQDIKAATDKEKHEKIGRNKQEAVDELCEEFPETGKYLRYVRSLGFEETPDYDYLRELFSDALKDEGEEDNDEYPWTWVKDKPFLRRIL